jgi:hypothetical protein
MGFLLRNRYFKEGGTMGLAAIWDSINTFSILIFYFRSSAAYVSRKV